MAPVARLNVKLVDVQKPLSLRLKDRATPGHGDTGDETDDETVLFGDPEITTVEPFAWAVVSFPKRLIAPGTTFRRPEGG